MSPTTAETGPILQALNAAAWPEADRNRARVAAALALRVYCGHTRDQGTPYLHHPVAVVTILRTELSVTHPATLLLGLLHDALEVSPTSEPQVVAHLGRDFGARLRAITPDHRLQQRPKQPGDEAAWCAKTAGLDPEALLVRLADRIHNLRDLHHSPDTGRRERFLATLADFYLPLAEAASPVNTHLQAVCALLKLELDRHQLREIDA